MIKSSAVSLTVREGNTASFPCTADGLPVPQISWTRETGELPLGRHVIRSDGTLVIRNAVYGDRGKYLCSARSILGQDRAESSLAVQGQENIK